MAQGVDTVARAILEGDGLTSVALDLKQHRIVNSILCSLNAGYKRDPGVDIQGLPERGLPLQHYVTRGPVPAQALRWRDGSRAVSPPDRFAN